MDISQDIKNKFMVRKDYLESENPAGAGPHN